MKDKEIEAYIAIVKNATRGAWVGLSLMAVCVVAIVITAISGG